MEFPKKNRFFIKKNIEIIREEKHIKHAYLLP